MLQRDGSLLVASATQRQGQDNKEGMKLNSRLLKSDSYYGIITVVRHGGIIGGDDDGAFELTDEDTFMSDFFCHNGKHPGMIS